MSDSAYILFDMHAANAILRAYIMDVTGFGPDAVLIETRTGPRPVDRGPYVTIYWREQDLLPQFDSPFSQPADDAGAGAESLKNETYCTVRITVRGDDAYNIASELRYQLDRGQRAFELWHVLGYAGTSNVTDLSAVYGAKVQQRAFIDLSFYAAFGRTYPLDWFDRAPWIVNGAQSILPARS